MNSPHHAKMICLIDTNVLVHFELLDQVDWTKHLSGSEVHLVLAPIVVRELDKLKDDHTSGARRDRVRSVFKWLEPRLLESSMEAPSRLRANVTLAALTQEPRADWASLDLDPFVNDDRLIASAMELRDQHRDATIIVVSNDLGPRLKGKARGITVMDPAGFMERRDLSSDAEKAHRELENQLNEFRFKHPILEVGFWDGNSFSKRIETIKPAAELLWATDEEIQKEVETERRSCARIPRSTAISTRQREEYDKKIEKYLVGLESYLKDQRLLRGSWRLELNFTLRNEGNAPAMNIESEIGFPDDSECMTTSAERDPYFGLVDSNRPVKPEPPKPVLFPTGYTDFGSFIMPTNVPIPGERIEPTINASGRFVRLSHPKLKSKVRYVFPAVTVFFRPTDRGGTMLSCTIHADELPDKIKSELHIVWK